MNKKEATEHLEHLNKRIEDLQHRILLKQIGEAKVTIQQLEDVLDGNVRITVRLPQEGIPHEEAQKVNRDINSRLTKKATANNAVPMLTFDEQVKKFTPVVEEEPKLNYDGANEGDERW